MSTSQDGLVDNLLEEWNAIEKSLFVVEEEHRRYVHKVDELTSVQEKCQKAIVEHKTRIKEISEKFESLKSSELFDSEEYHKSIEALKSKINKKSDLLRDMDEVLPHENSIYLKIVLGSVNVSLLSKRDKYKYKQNYEHFKLYVTLIIFIFALILWFFLNYRVTDAIFQFLLVWYYCTLTVREHILKMNGSRIKGWWITHHFISTACAGLFLIWPDGFSYHYFRPQYIIFAICLTIVQLTQFYYQTGSLYRLRALGERRNMDITVDGFQSWMWKGLTFVIPLLVLVYLFQFYNAFTLIKLSFHPRCSEWQVFVLGITFFILFFGNTSTIVYVMMQKSKGNLTSNISHKYKAQTPTHSHNTSNNSSASNNSESPVKKKSKDQ